MIPMNMMNFKCMHMYVSWSKVLFIVDVLLPVDSERAGSECECAKF